MKNNLYRFIGDQTQFDMPSGAKMRLDQNHIQIQTLPPSMHHKWKVIIDFVCKITLWKSEEINSQQKVPL